MTFATKRPNEGKILISRPTPALKETEVGNAGKKRFFEGLRTVAVEFEGHAGLFRDLRQGGGIHAPS